MPPGSAGVPPAQCRGTASAISATRIDPERRRASLSVWPLRFTPTGWLPAEPRGSSATTISNSMRAGRPRSRGDLLPLMGWGDGRVGAGDRCFFYEHRCTGCTGLFRKRLACIPGNPQSPTAAAPWLSFGLAVAVTADVVAVCRAARKLSDHHKQQHAGGTPALPGAITPHWRGSRRSRGENWGRERRRKRLSARTRSPRHCCPCG